MATTSPSHEPTQALFSPFRVLLLHYLGSCLRAACWVPLLAARTLLLLTSRGLRLRLCCWRLLVSAARSFLALSHPILSRGRGATYWRFPPAGCARRTIACVPRCACLAGAHYAGNARAAGAYHLFRCCGGLRALPGGSPPLRWHTCMALLGGQDLFHDATD